MSNAEQGCSSPIYTLGFILAAIISFTTNKSILWLILHGFFSWFYVIYYVLGFGR